MVAVDNCSPRFFWSSLVSWLILAILNEPLGCAIPRQPQVFPQHPGRNARVHDARRRRKQVADPVKGERRDRIVMRCSMQLGDVPVDEPNSRGTSPDRLGNAQVGADRNTPWNLNDLSCPTKKCPCQ